MSILQEYGKIKKSLGTVTNQKIDEYLGLNPEIRLSDIYYSQEHWDQFKKWCKTQKKGGF
jgi:DNA topoisomerase VI subunit A